jgi:hypothetical protein
MAEMELDKVLEKHTKPGSRTVHGATFVAINSKGEYSSGIIKVMLVAHSLSNHREYYIPKVVWVAYHRWHGSVDA